MGDGHRWRAASSLIAGAGCLLGTLIRGLSVWWGSEGVAHSFVMGSAEVRNAEELSI